MCMQVFIMFGKRVEFQKFSFFLRNEFGVDLIYLFKHLQDIVTFSFTMCKSR